MPSGDRKTKGENEFKETLKGIDIRTRRGPGYNDDEEIRKISD